MKSFHFARKMPQGSKHVSNIDKNMVESDYAPTNPITVTCFIKLTDFFALTATRKGKRAYQPKTFQTQTSTLDLSTPDFSTMNFSTPSLLRRHSLWTAPYGILKVMTSNLKYGFFPL
jgi:hypothetical protein